jgi:hypothetical protein
MRQVFFHLPSFFTSPRHCELRSSEAIRKIECNIEQKFFIFLQNNYNKNELVGFHISR